MSLESDITFPVEGDDCLVLAATSSNQRATIPAGLRGRYVDISVEGADVYLLAGDSSVVADPAATSGDTRCDVFFASSKTTKLIATNTAEYTDLAYRTSSGTATVRIFPSSTKPFTF